MEKGLIFDIQKFCVSDGPGIRTTVFLKGCPLNCAWCHNPESKKKKIEIFYNPQKCVLCQRCASVCPSGAHEVSSTAHTFLREKCTSCTLCADACPTKALEVVGRLVSVQEVLEEVLKDKIFYETSDGGVTLSGGEPMYQFDFTLSLLKSCKENGLHTAMETCGFAPSENYKDVAPFVDLFLFDYKLFDPELSKKYTGADNELILKNLALLDSLDKKIILRCPIIPDINDCDEHFAKIAKTANKHKNIIEINVEPYHPLGIGKAEKLDVEYSIKASSPSKSDVQRYIDKIKENTDVPVIKA